MKSFAAEPLAPSLNPARTATRVPATTPSTCEFVVSDRQWPGEPIVTSFRRLDAELEARDATLLGLMVYGGLGARAEVERAMFDALGAAEWPVTWVDGSPAPASVFSGFQAFAISERQVTRIRMGRKVVASVYNDGTARHCLLGGIGPTSTGLRPAAQTDQTLANLEWALELAGFSLGDVVRTWFYNDNIVAWYRDFNRVRSGHYGRVPFRTNSLPASTGIGARNSAGAALTMAAWAMKPITGEASAHEIGSPLQCPAPAYGSSFSRAMELVSGGCRRLFISGTASIWPDGRTAWVDDPAKQVALTMDVVSALLKSRSMSFSDITRGTAYFQSIELKRHFDAWCDRNELRRLPVIALQADVCRDDLLFEIEVDAVASREESEASPSFDI